MATVVSRSNRGVRPKFILFACIGLMLLYVLYHNERFLVDPADPNWPRYRDFWRVLLPHGVLGALALFLGFMQFSTRLRTRHPFLHRICGRVYVVCVLVAAPLGATLGFLDRSIGYTDSFATATTVQGSLWLLATVAAFFCIRRRKIEQHRQWMTRSLSMALLFAIDRVIAGATGWGDNPATDTTVAWVCIASAYPLADITLWAEELIRARLRPSAG